MSEVHEKPVQKNGHFAVAQRARVIPEKMKREHRRVPWARFAAAAKELDRDPVALAKDIGYSGAIGSWSRSGNCPMVAVIAAEAIIERRKLRTEVTQLRAKTTGTAESVSPPVRLLVSFPETPEQLKALLSFCGALGITHQFFEPKT